MKAKGINILILIIYAYAVQQPEHDWYMKTGKDTFVSIRKIHEKFDITTWLLLPQFHAVTGCDRVSYFFNVSKRVVFERASSGITTFNPSRPNPGRIEKINLNFYFHTTLWCLKKFFEGL